MRLPLEGIRILDNGIVQAGTFPSRLLADFGAEVVRVENYSKPDVSRNVVFENGAPSDPYWESGGVYHEQHRNKALCIGLDVRKSEGREAYLRLAKVCDIVMDSHPPGVMEKLGLHYDALKVARPDIIFISTSGYGYGGPFSSVRSYGMMTEIMCGIGSLNGYEGEPARRGACPLTDHPSTYHAAFLMMAALIRRKRTGEGSWIDISQYEIGVNTIGDAFLANAIGAAVPARSAHFDPGSLFSGVFKSAGDERWLAISATTAHAWQGLCSIVGRSDLSDADHRDVAASAAAREALVPSVSAWSTALDTKSAMAALDAAGIAAAPVNDARDLLLDEHLKERSFFRLVDHAPKQHAGRRAWPGPSANLVGTPGEVRRRAPLLGEHNRTVATTLLGYTGEEFDQLEADGVFGVLPMAAGVKPAAANVPSRTGLPTAAFTRSKLHDPDFTKRLTARFGHGYGK